MINNEFKRAVDGVKTYGKLNAFIGSTSLASECSSMINRKGHVRSTVNSNRVLSGNEKRAHLNAFVKRISVVTAKTSLT